MIVLLAAVTAVVVVVIGLLAVGAVTGRLSTEAPRTILDLDQAVVDVADRLPPDATAVLSYDDVRVLLGWYVDYLEDKGVAWENDHELEGLPSGPVVAEDDEAVAYVLGLATDAGMEVEDVAVAQVLEAATAHLAAIGAIGVEVTLADDATPPDDPNAARD